MFKKLFIIVAFVVVVIPALWLGFPYYTAKTVEITVTDKERVPDGQKGSYYLVFTENEVFQNVDVLRRLKTTSSDLQGRLQVGKSFEVTVYGWRIPLLSKYRNIVSINAELTPAMVAAISMDDLPPRVDRVRETKLPTAVLFRQRSHPQVLAESLKGQFPDLTIRVYGDEPSDVWGIMIYWNPLQGIILEATPLPPGGDRQWPIEWGPRP